MIITLYFAQLFVNQCLVLSEQLAEGSTSSPALQDHVAYLLLSTLLWVRSLFHSAGLFLIVLIRLYMSRDAETCHRCCWLA